MDCYSYKRKRIDESGIVMVPETGFSLHQGWPMGLPISGTPFISGEFMEVSQQFPIRQYQSRAVQFVSPQTGATSPLDRGALNGVNGLLTDAQIHQFISSTVLPHHRTLTRTGLGRVTRPLIPQTYTPGVKERLLGTGIMTTPTSSLTYMEVSLCFFF
uniref:Uncharacterized protein LOC111124127 n=1 Tax=Crassostrea virginica TaxID=6565 RepID=A0A8B8D3N2_CRAVI|nr:uncharacterized protein LOC111124127 [Crassostrea virginica]